MVKKINQNGEYIKKLKKNKRLIKRKWRRYIPLMKTKQMLKMKSWN